MYVFSFALDIPPDIAVTISPTVVSGLLKASPAKITFTNASAGVQLKGNFLLSGSAGVHTVLLMPSGPSQALYAVSQKTVTVLSNSAPPTPPVIQSAVFSLSGVRLYAYFSTPTDGAETIAELQGLRSWESWPCRAVFSFTGVNSAACSWLNSSTAQIEFSSDPSVKNPGVGSPVSILGGRIKALCTEDSCDYLYASSSTTQALAPANPVLPKIVINNPSLISTCDLLTIDATATTGSGGTY